VESFKYSARVCTDRNEHSKAGASALRRIHESEALRIPEDKAEQLVDALNTDLAATYVLYHQVKKHHWLVEGAEFRDITSTSVRSLQTSKRDADVLAERAQALGGVPLSGGANYEEHAPISP